MSDWSGRTVHAESDEAQIVRYNRSGKWYIEPKSPGTPRRHVSVKAAASAAAGRGYRVNLGMVGGQRFDTEIRRLKGATR